jgi:hypothetical protein
MSTEHSRSSIPYTLFGQTWNETVKKKFFVFGISCVKTKNVLVKLRTKPATDDLPYPYCLHRLKA